ncbi:hypothetical protein BJ508DRAFT_302767 [Ascobolus immersus RN42]|uniref:Uncharacterized protein n=1 Tax=Ascobolus immersus RN42 TaxID=1160509 RepID=A0A3N4IMS7_ASCIM|nr:hypothetical protein BJ508DRAFT_302767 [Ascobolus immersus RN42]
MEMNKAVEFREQDSKERKGSRNLESRKPFNYYGGGLSKRDNVWFGIAPFRTQRKEGSIAAGSSNGGIDAPQVGSKRFMGRKQSDGKVQSRRAEKVKEEQHMRSTMAMKINKRAIIKEEDGSLSWDQKKQDRKKRQDRCYAMQNGPEKRRKKPKKQRKKSP